ncbi:MAG TPA: peptidoglycan DD-metalloendopeptidase family protein [Oscillatoriaceae cyanobacterium M33_DOE_052]|uniref:SLH domain-containing protein n=1 Tax=Planktothricoides sp. SpSt-374 TaxID=2282167 RepID=A0A7C3ZXG6_9CYAN|nr:peptidoglycan DD-metalloendopeptidase family protein [Oscillatoriaceae cyanobacterium M33_DOE_052]
MNPPNVAILYPPAVVCSNQVNDYGCNEALANVSSHSWSQYQSTALPAGVGTASGLTDVHGHWAEDFILALQQLGIVRGFPDGTFRPEAPMTEAQLASLLIKAFSHLPLDDRRQLPDYPPPPPAGESPVELPAHWATTAMLAAAQMGFFPASQLGNPNQLISRLDVVVALVKGLDLKAPPMSQTNVDFEDATEIPDDARESFAAAIASGLIVMNPQEQFFHPQQIATRADVAAFLYQALLIKERLGESGSQGASEPASQRANEPGIWGNSITPSTITPSPRPELTQSSGGSTPELAPPQGRVPLWNGHSFSSYSSQEDSQGVTATATIVAPSLVEPAPQNRPSQDPPRRTQGAETLAVRVIDGLENLRFKMQGEESENLDNIPAPQLPPLGAANIYLPEEIPAFDGYIWPTTGTFTSGYGWRWGRMHYGIDIAGPIGTPIMAAAAGVITYADWSDGYGYLVEIQHADGSLTRYAHNSRILVREGELVDQGQQISEMGSTGRSTGPHLHFEIHQPDSGPVNPLALLPGEPPSFASGVWGQGGR